MPMKIALLPGDGIGPEVTAEAVRILQERRRAAGTPFTFSTHADRRRRDRRRRRRRCPRRRSKRASSADAVLLGAVGHPKFDGRLPSERPEAALLALRQALGGFANLRPAICYRAAARSAPRFSPSASAAPTC